MLFPRNALASGPQACFSAEKGMAKVKEGKTGFSLLTPDQVWYRKIEEDQEPHS